MVETNVTGIENEVSSVSTPQDSAGRLLTPGEVEEALQLIGKLLDGLGTVNAHFPQVALDSRRFRRAVAN